MAMKCQKLGIPEYLHRQERPIDNQFLTETIFRRFDVAGEPSDWRNDKGISASIFPVKDDSCNRDKYSEKPEDVLYNTREEDGGSHYVNMGILSFCSSTIDNFTAEINQNNIKRIFTLKLKHDPLECMYPHCEILVLENGQILDQNKPKSIKTLIRDILLDKITIVKEPSSI